MRHVTSDFDHEFTEAVQVLTSYVLRQGKLNSQFIVTARINFLMVTKIFIFQYGPRPLKIRGVVRTDVIKFFSATCPIAIPSMAEQLVSVQVVSSNRCIVPWSVVPVEPTSSFDHLLSSLKAGRYSVVSPSEFLSKVTLESVSVGKDKSSMSVVGKDMNVSDVSRSFGSYVRLRVDDTTEG